MNKRIRMLLALLIALCVLLTACSAVRARLRPAPRPTPAPKVGSKTVPVNPPKYEQEVKGLASRTGFDTFEWQVLELPATTTWDEIVAYYNSEMQRSGWSGDGSKSANPEGHQVGSWVDSDFKDGLVIIYVPGSGGTPVNVIVIFGQGPKEGGG